MNIIRSWIKPDPPGTGEPIRELLDLLSGNLGNGRKDPAEVPQKATVKALGSGNGDLAEGCGGSSGARVCGRSPGSGAATASGSTPDPE